MNLLKRSLHTTIVTKDIDKLSCFYQVLFNAEVIKDINLDSNEFQKGIGLPNIKARTIHLYSSSLSLTLELTQFDDQLAFNNNEKKVNSTGFRHLAFEVNDINFVINKLREKNLSFSLVTEQPAAVKTENGVIEFIYLRDIELNIIELINYKEL